MNGTTHVVFANTVCVWKEEASMSYWLCGVVGIHEDMDSIGRLLVVDHVAALIRTPVVGWAIKQHE